MSVRGNFYLWLASLAALLLALALMLPRLKLDTDLLSLLPQATPNPALQAATEAASGQFSKRLTILVSAPHAEQAQTAAAAYARSLASSPDIASAEWRSAGTSLISPAQTAARFGLLAPSDAALLAQGGASGSAPALAQQALQALYSPAAAPLTAVADDPLGLFDHALKQALRPPGLASLLGEALAVQNAQGTHVLVMAQTRHNPFSAQGQGGLASSLAQAAQAAQALGATVAVSGVAPHAIAAGAQARREAGALGGGSTLACALLVWLVFGTLRPALLALLSMAFGMVLALVLTHALFGHLHLLTVVFGTSLIGVSLDYALHFLSDQFRSPKSWQPPDALPHIGTAVTLGLATTALGYGAFATAPMPVLRQMALFSVLGLLGAAFTVWMALPVLARPAPLPRAAQWLKLANALGPRRLPRWAWVLLALGSVAGLARLQVSDSPKDLQNSPPALIAQERTVATTLGAGFDRRFFVVLGNNAEQVLQREEALSRALAALPQALDGWRAVSTSIPSLAHQAANLARIAPLYTPDGEASKLLNTLGFLPSTLAKQRAQLSANTPLTIAALSAPALAPIAPLWLGEVQSGVWASLVSLEGVHQPAALAGIALPHTFYQDPIGQAETVLASQRKATGSRMVWAYIATLALLLLRYGPRGGLLCLLPPLLASATTLAIMAGLGRPMTLFTALTLLPVLGFGVDYAIFLREGAGHGAPASSRLAVWLAAATALLSFGGLAFSATPFLHDIGLTLSLGVAFSLLYALALAPDHESLQH